ncbi:unnamed protein product, partial [Symbiodinium sp. CCMP2456]
MCNKSAKRGSLQVSADVAEKWKCTKSRKQLIVALINCKGDKATGLHNTLPRMKDKYQSHIVEYWVDVRTSGSLSRSTKEEFNQYVEIIDSG